MPKVVLPGGIIKVTGSRADQRRSRVHGAEGAPVEEQPQQPTAPRAPSQIGAILGRVVRRAGEQIGVVKPPPLPSEGPVGVGGEDEAFEGEMGVRSRTPAAPSDDPKPQPRKRNFLARGKRTKQGAPPDPSVMIIARPQNATWEARQSGRRPPFLMYKNWPEAFKFYTEEGYWVEGNVERFLVRGLRPGHSFAPTDDVDRLHRARLAE